MSQTRGHFESFQSNFATSDGVSGRSKRNYTPVNVYQDQDRIYTAQAPQAMYKRDMNFNPNQDQYDQNSDRYYDDPDQEAQYIYEQTPHMHPRERRYNQARVYNQASPNMHNPHSMDQQMMNQQYRTNPDFPHQQESHSRSRKLYTMNRGGSKYVHTPEYNDIDEQEAQLFTSLSQAELKDHVIQNINSDDYDQQDQSEMIIQQLHKKLGKLSRQYLKLIGVIKKSDYIRGSNTTVSYAQLKELENIGDRLDSNSQADTSRDNDIFKAIGDTIKEIEDHLNHHGNSYSCNDIIKYIKQKLNEVYISESVNKSHFHRGPSSENYKDSEDFDGIKGRLDFENAIKDLTKNYEWLKKKSIKSLSGIEEKYSQIQIDIDELDKTMVNYSSQSRTASRDEMSDLPALLQDACDLVTHTNESVNVHLENSLNEVGYLREAIDQYHDIIEEKMRELYKPDLKIQGDRPTDIKLHEELMKVKSDAKTSERHHKKLFNEVEQNMKLLQKLMSPNTGPDSKAEIKELYSKSNRDLKDLIKKQQKLFKKKSHAKSSNKNSMSRLLRSSSKEIRAQKKIVSQSSAPNEGLLQEISTLKSQLTNLKLENEIKDSKIQDSENLKTRISLLKSEYEETKKSNFDLETEVENKTSQISSLERENLKMTNRIKNLQSELQDLENILTQNKDTEFESVREMRNIISQAKRSCKEQILSQEKELGDKFDHLNSLLSTKNTKIMSLESIITDLRMNQLPKLKISDQSLHLKDSEINRLKADVNRTTEALEKLKIDKTSLEGKLHKAQRRIQEILGEKEDAQRQAEDKENLTNSLYEERLRDKDKEIHAKNKQVTQKESEIIQLKEEAIALEDRINNIEAKVNSAHSLVETYGDQIARKNGKPNPTIQLILETIEEVSKEKASSNNSENQRLIQMQELLREKEVLSEKISKLESDLHKANASVHRLEQENYTLTANLEDEQLKLQDELNSKETLVQKHQRSIQNKETELALWKDKFDKSNTSSSQHSNSAMEKQRILEKYVQLVDNICNYFSFTNTINQKEEESKEPLLEGLFVHLDSQKRETEKTIKNLKDQIKENSVSMVDRSEVETATKQHNELQLQIQAKEDEIDNLQGIINTLKEENSNKVNESVVIPLRETITNFQNELAEKDKVIASNAQNMELMRSSTIKLKEGLQDYETKLTKIITEREEAKAEQKKAQFELSRVTQELNDVDDELTKVKSELSKANSELSETKPGFTQVNEELSETKQKLEQANSQLSQAKSEFEVSAKSLEKIKTELQQKDLQLAQTQADLKDSHDEATMLKSKLEKAQDTADVDYEAEIESSKVSLLNTINSHLTVTGKTSELESKISDPTSSDVFKIVIEKIQQKDPNIAAKHDQILQSQIEANIGEGKPEMLPSLQTQLQILKNESENTEVTRDMSEHLLENFERNDKAIRDKLEKAVEKIKFYKQKIKEYKVKLSDLCRPGLASYKNPSDSKMTAEERVQLIADIKKQIREEEIKKRDKEIERQRKVMAQKSEEQSIEFNQRMEELEAKLEAKDNENTDLLIKIQENETEIEQLKQAKERKSVMSYDEQLDQLTDDPPAPSNPTKYETQLIVFERVEKLNEKIIEFGEKIGQYRHEMLTKLEEENQEVNNNNEDDPAKKIEEIKAKEISKLERITKRRAVVQVVRKLEAEGLSWLLLEQKDHYDKPLELKSSNSHSKSSILGSQGSRKLWWVCEEYLPQDLLDYVFSCTPSFLFKSASLKLNLPDLFSESEKESVKLLRETSKDLIAKREELLKDQREIMLGLRRENFLLEDTLTAETEDRLRELENKNLEFEQEIQSLHEENVAFNSKNTELLCYINVLNIRIKELNGLIYDFSRDKTNEEILNRNAALIAKIDKIKQENMETEVELEKLKTAIERRKIRLSRPSKLDAKKEFEGRQSQESFHFDADNDIFSDSFIIDSNNKELEDKCKQIEEELNAANDLITQKNKQIVELEGVVEKLESDIENKKKSESFEVMNSDSLKHIKGTLIQFLRNVPFTEKNNEILLNVVFDMLYMTSKEIKDIKEARNKLQKSDTPKKKKGSGLFSRLIK
ncbi:unnamed protein product [Moneuplotes crassus]|uniref:Uncharacterized protein n=2 Tax=Euplotes crassus TaxID=5936 RepID=A0AAD2D4J4_EUPCR|nr:unnamed protein product [Moneuplotes crassus]